MLNLAMIRLFVTPVNHESICQRSRVALKKMDGHIVAQCGSLTKADLDSGLNEMVGAIHCCVTSN